MLFVYTENIITVFTILIFCNILSNKNNVNSYSVSTTEKLKGIYLDHLDDALKHFQKNGNYAEGGLVREQSTEYSSVSKNKFSNPISEGYSAENLNKSELNDNFLNQNNSSKTKTKTVKLHKYNYIHSNTISGKLNDTDTNLLLGMAEVIHVNGISPIKPRKGVELKEDSAYEKNHSVLALGLCSWLTDDKCYSVDSVNSSNCYCCKSRITPLQLLECSQCHLVNISLDEINKCQGFCCGNSDINLPYKYMFESSNQTATKIYSSERSKKIVKKILPELNATTLKALGEIESNYSGVSKKYISENSIITPKLKPEITKVPYDVNIVNNLLKNSTKEIILYVTASIFLIPIFGIFIYFVWKHTKDYWEKRYYKRVDFLIDGMYND